MKARVSVSEFTQRLALLQGVVSRKPVVPMLSHILLETSENFLQKETICLSAVNPGMSVRANCQCEILKKGSAAVSARNLFDITRSIEDPYMYITKIEKNRILIESEKTKVTIPTLSSKEFPSFPNVSDISWMTVEADPFAQMIHKIIYAASSDDSRHNLTGIFIEPSRKKDGHVTFVATDGHRLSKFEKIFSDANFRNIEPVIMPKKGLLEALKILESRCLKSEVFFKFGIAENRVAFQREDVLLVARLIEGSFPDYAQVVPTSCEKAIIMPKKNILSSLRRVAVFSDSNARDLKIFLSTGRLVISCKNPVMGEVVDTVVVDYVGGDLEMGFNTQYVAEALASISGDVISINLADATSPMLIIDEAEKDHVCVIMPMRV